MKARITAKSELQLSSLTRQYTFDIITDSNQDILASQVIESRPSEVITRLQTAIVEYQAAYEEANDVEVGEEV